MELSARAVTFADPVARRLVFEQWCDMNVRYGGDLPCDEDEALPTGCFELPEGLFLIAEGDGAPVGCGGFRRCEQGPPATAEVKRLFVVPAGRGAGVARFLMHELERAAFAAGYQQMWLETGTKQPEALGLYAAMGYDRIPPYGEYKHSPDSVCFAKDLGPNLRGTP